jgi:hypothetical protein
MYFLFYCAAHRFYFNAITIDTTTATTATTTTNL